MNEADADGMRQIGRALALAGADLALARARTLPPPRDGRKLTEAEARAAWREECRVNVVAHWHRAAGLRPPGGEA